VRAETNREGNGETKKDYIKQHRYG
jgi:hypothetical protein